MMIIKKITPNISPKKGFMLVESLVSISIVILVITVSMGSIVLYSQSNRDSSSRTTASYLVIDSLEYIRQLKDSNIIKKSRGQNVLFTSGIAPGCLSGADCMVDTTIPIVDASTYVQDCTAQGGAPQGFGAGASASSCPVLKYNETSGYQYNYGSDGKYNRTIKITYSATTPHYMTVQSSVTWSDKGQSNRVSATVDLYDW